MLTGCRRKKAASGQEVERGGEQRLCQRIDSRGFAFARTANAERQLATKALLELPQPGCRARRRARIAGIDDQEGFAVLAGPLQRPRRANRGGQAFATGDDEAGVAVAYIPFRALQGMRLLGLLEVWIVGKQAGRLGEILGPAPLRAPTAPVQTALDGHIQRGAVDAALAAADDLHGCIMTEPGRKTIPPKPAGPPKTSRARANQPGGRRPDAAADAGLARRGARPTGGWPSALADDEAAARPIPGLPPLSARPLEDCFWRAEGSSQATFSGRRASPWPIARCR